MNEPVSTRPGPTAANTISTGTPSQTLSTSIGRFDWTVYADATLAGLSVLIPIPFLDSAAESFFRRRMPSAIAGRSGKTMHPTALSVLNRTRPRDMIIHVLLWPFQLTVGFLLRLSRKLLYFLTVKKAVDALVYYWQRAFLLDYLVQRGYIVRGAGYNEAQTERAILVLEQLLNQEKGMPLRHLARHLTTQALRHTFHLGRMLRHAVRGKEDAKLATVRADMASNWGQLSSYWADLATRYEEMYRTMP